MRIENDSFAAWKSSVAATNKRVQSMARISSGMILNTDNPSGIGISEAMRAEYRSTSQAVRNVETAISMTQTQDGWLKQANDIVSRMQSLAVEAGGIMSASDKANVNTEFTAMRDELVRMTSGYTAAAKFNGVYLTRGGNGQPTQSGDGVQQGSVNVQVGGGESQSISSTMPNLDVNNNQVIGQVNTYNYDDQNKLVSQNSSSVKWSDITKMTVDTPNAIGMLSSAVDFVSGTRASTAALQKRYEQTYEGLMAYESNLREAESKIRDIDMAAESMNSASAAILSAVGSAMIAQGNNITTSAIERLG